MPGLDFESRLWEFVFMIVSDLDHIRSRVVMTPAMETAVKFLESSGGQHLEPGRLVVDGDRVYVEVQQYETIAGEITTFEGHRRYIDIQYVVDGEEIIGWASVDDVQETTPYVDEHDYWLASAEPSAVTSVKLHNGQMAVLYPEDMHAPRRASGAPSTVSKLVVKVAID
jgi:YhcH/YjgK/YiaL family protein